MSFHLSYSQKGPTKLHGISNYYLPIYGSQDRKVIQNLYFIDSNEPGSEGYDNQGSIAPDQVQWYKEGPRQPALAFFHIPIQVVVFLC